MTPSKSPPDSFITGADSSVIADSSTVANPFITTPSAGIVSPFSTRIFCPAFNSVAFTIRYAPFSSINRAVKFDCACLKLSACAFPRPSAKASEKLANNIVINNMIKIVIK
ncbi:Uncharacterised protein [Staphylococcus aureus]|nr:Uncharacterised protein [Staphylococcus aureus]